VFGGFGAQKTGNAFGQPAQAAPSAFGGFGTPAVPASGGLFGAKPAGAIPTTGGSLFGGGGFAIPAAPSSNLFGASQSIAKPGGMFGASTGFNGTSSFMTNNGANALQASIDKNPYGNNVCQFFNFSRFLM
jgi:hypothetical protein